MDKKYHYVYQTKNLINGKTYIGIHSTDNLNDGYIGCGIKSKAHVKAYMKRSSVTPFARAVNKYGYENFKPIILSFYNSREEASEEEEFLVDKKWVLKNDNYNIVTGGNNGRVPFSKLEEQRENIENQVIQGVSINSLAKQYNCASSTIKNIVKDLEEYKIKVLQSKERKVILYEDGTHTFFRYYYEAEELTGIRRDTIRHQLNSKYESKKYPKFLTESNFNTLGFKKDIKEITKTRYTNLIIEHILGEKKTVINSYQLAKELGVSEVETRYVLSGKRGRVGWWYLSGSKTLEKDREKYLRYVKDPEGNKVQVLSLIQYGLKKYCGEKGLIVEPFCGILYGYRNYYKGYTPWQEIN